MTDMMSVIAPKSDQINADDLIGASMTITIRDVKITGGQEQPVSMLFDGSEKAFRPCKSMSRVIVSAWGPDTSKYIGRSLTLFRDPSVKWGGMEVGGIRISHMSDIESAMTLALTMTRANKKPFTVKPIVAAPVIDRAADWANAQVAALANAPDLVAVEQAAEKGLKALAKLATERPELHAQVVAAEAQARSQFPEPDAFGLLPVQPDTREAIANDLIERLGNADASNIAAIRDEWLTHANDMPDELYAKVRTVLDAAELRTAAK